MAEIITFGSSKDKDIESKRRIKKLRIIIEKFNSLDKFTKTQIVAILFFILATPTIVGGYLVLRPKAAALPSVNISTAALSPTRNVFNRLPQGKSSVPPVTSYSVDPAVLKQFNDTNQLRSQNGMPPLQADANLTCAADSKNQDMDQSNYFSHPSPSHNGAMTWDWAYSPCGYTVWGTAGENIGQDNYPPDQDESFIFNAFVSSPEHKANILGKAWKVIGISRKYDSSRGFWMWSIEFGDTVTRPVNYVADSSTIPSTPSPSTQPKTCSPTTCSGICVLNSCILGTRNATPTPSPAPTPTPTPISTGPTPWGPPTGLSATTTFCQSTASGFNFAWTPVSSATSYQVTYGLNGNNSQYGPYSTSTNSLKIPNSSCTTGPGGCSFSYGVLINFAVKACNSTACTNTASGSRTSATCSGSNPTPTPPNNSTPVPTINPTPTPTVTYNPPTYYCTYGGATGYSYKNLATGVCSNGTYTSFYHSPTCTTTSSDLGKSVLIQTCNYVYFSSSNCSGSIVGYHQCTSRTVTAN